MLPILFLVLLAQTAAAATHKIDVSNSASDLTISPSSIVAAIGDTVEFGFFSTVSNGPTRCRCGFLMRRARYQDFAVLQAEFRRPCKPVRGDHGFFSGFVVVGGDDEMVRRRTDVWPAAWGLTRGPPDSAGRLP